MNPSAPRVLKAHALRSVGSNVVFNYDDLQRRCEEHLESVRQQARSILEEAQREAEQLRAAAAQEGREAGRREGLGEAQQAIRKEARREAERMTAETLATALPALKAAAEALVLERDRWLLFWETRAVQLSVCIAGKLLRRKIDADPDAALEMIRETLRLASGGAQLRLRLNPADLDRLGPTAAELVQHIACCGRAELVPDGAISSGGCIIDTIHGTIDARIETQLDRIAAELSEQDVQAVPGRITRHDGDR